MIDYRIKYSIPEQIWGVPIYIETAQASGANWHLVNARYTYSQQKIQLFPRLFESGKSPEVILSIMWHEYMHHLHLRVIPKELRWLWWDIHNFYKETIDTINSKLWTNYTKNAFANNYAETSMYEDLSESYEERFLQLWSGKYTEYEDNDILWLKVRLAKEIMSEYYNK